MPAVVARAPMRIVRVDFPEAWTSPKSLSERIGRTHGMPLRMKPPSRARNRIAVNERAGTGVAVVAAAAMAGGAAAAGSGGAGVRRRHGRRPGVGEVVGGGGNAAGTDREVDRGAGLDRRQALAVVAGLVAQVQHEPHRAERRRRRHVEPRHDAGASLEDVELVVGEGELVLDRRGIVDFGDRPARGRFDGERRRNEVVVGRDVRLQVPAGFDLQARRQPDRLARKVGAAVRRSRKGGLLQPDRRPVAGELSAAGTGGDRRQSQQRQQSGQSERRAGGAPGARPAGALQEHSAAESDFRDE